MKEKIEHLINWSEWGRQWVDYLRRKPALIHELERQVRKFDAAFHQIGDKARQLQKSEPDEAEIRRLTARAEEVQHHFHQLLHLVQSRRNEEKADVTYVNQRQSVAVTRPVPPGGHTLPPLPYAYDALEPYIDAETMRIHHNRHHQSYVDGLNKAELMLARARAANDYELIKHWEREAAFNGAGHYLHTIFWQVMSPNGGGEPQGELAEQLIRDFGSIDGFRRHFSQAAEKVEGGGWAILVWSPRAQHLEILQAEKHQNLSQWDVIPLLVLDVWEHAYYLSYRNDRGRYIDAWWNVVNWPHVQDRYLQARRLRWQPY
ncbi:superoxide dismutase [Brevibacillus sp. SYP-B805]|uniref:superoxide dismutase n=1 Tax=Brevibacillus sp. SYP-B805 TaxID=1578199 RepID=UPI0013EC57A1|nr:superoxide dismutase [Brevibacillus sp. SYP-B805]NGQ94385.1 superoxide dismutase [Brevibacillus sp. SYP-B805]